MKKILTTFLFVCFVVNISFAFDPYADDEPEKRSKTKLYCGIAMALIGGFLAYDGFSQEEVDISKPSVDYGGSINAMWIQNEDGASINKYSLYTGSGTPKDSGGGSLSGSVPNEQNIIYNTGNVDLTNVKVYVRYRYTNGNVIYDDSLKHGETPVKQDSDGYFLALDSPGSTTLAVNGNNKWDDKTTYDTGETTPPLYGADGEVHYGENALKLVNVKVTYDYKKKYRKQNKSDIEGVAGLMVATAGIYFIVDYFMDLHKFNMYMKRKDMKIRLANAPNEYKLVFQKRL